MRAGPLLSVVLAGLTHASTADLIAAIPAGIDDLVGFAPADLIIVEELTAIPPLCNQLTFAEIVDGEIQRQSFAGDVDRRYRRHPPQTVYSTCRPFGYARCTPYRLHSRGSVEGS